MGIIDDIMAIENVDERESKVARLASGMIKDLLPELDFVILFHERDSNEDEGSTLGITAHPDTLPEIRKIVSLANRMLEMQEEQDTPIHNYDDAKEAVNHLARIKANNKREADDGTS